MPNIKRGIRPETPNHFRNQKLYEVGYTKSRRREKPQKLNY